MTFFVMLSFSSTVLAMGTCQELFHLGAANKNISSESSSSEFERAKADAAQGRLKTSHHIKSYKGLTNAQLFEVAKIAAAQNGSGTSENIKNYEGLTNAQLFKVAKISAAAQNGWALYIKNYEGLTQVQLFKIAKIAIRSAQYLAPGVARRFSFIHEKARSLSRLAEVVIPLSEQIENHISEIQSLPDLKTYLSGLEDSSLMSQYPHVVQLAWDQIQKRETGLALIREALRLVVRKQPLPKTSLELLAKVSGLQLSLLPKNISNDTLGKVYELALEIQENLYGPFKLKPVVIGVVSTPMPLAVQKYKATSFHKKRIAPSDSPRVPSCITLDLRF